jgi:hypothetical protein
MGRTPNGFLMLYLFNNVVSLTLLLMALSSETKKLRLKLMYFVKVNIDFSLSQNVSDTSRNIYKIIMTEEIVEKLNRICGENTSHSDFVSTTTKSFLDCPFPRSL